MQVVMLICGCTISALLSKVCFTTCAGVQSSSAISGFLAQRSDDSRVAPAEQLQLFSFCSVGAALLGASGIALGLTRQKSRVSMQYTTQMILPAYAWLKVGYKTKDLQPGDLKTVAVAGCDICIGKTASGKLFGLGDKLPPTGISLSVGGEVQGEKVKEAQYGNIFDAFTGEPEGPWCPEPPLVGAFVGAFMGGAYPVATFETREAFLSGDVEILLDTNAKRAYEADYWKGILDAQGKDDGSYY